jgi:hypothetical protein
MHQPKQLSITLLSSMGPQLQASSPLGNGSPWLLHITVMLSH